MLVTLLAAVFGVIEEEMKNFIENHVETWAEGGVVVLAKWEPLWDV
jgi:hypothetical protein